MPDTGGLLIPFVELGIRDGTSPVVSLDLETMSVQRRLGIDATDLKTAIAQLIGFLLSENAGQINGALIPIG